MLKKIFFSLITVLALTPSAWTQSRETWNINPGWRFTTETTQSSAISIELDDSSWDLISLPHTMRYFPSNLNEFKSQGRLLGWYRREIQIPQSWNNKQLLLVFQGAMQATHLYINGESVGSYRVSGYDSFHFDITKFIKTGLNLITVEVDNRETKELPPDGVKRDFILFGGLYRDVELVVTDPVHITCNWDSAHSGIEVRYPAITKQQANIEISTETVNNLSVAANITLKTEILNPTGKLVATAEKIKTINSGERALFNLTIPPIKNPQLWSPDTPALYNMISTLIRDGKEIDRIETKIGLRWIEWNKKKGFLLNGDKLELVGTNRHQTWPFIGNALPNELHRRDAQQIKSMGMNWIRLSHYPHDPDFLDDLDELGILALEEGPTWMNRIQGKWMENLETSFRRMIRRDKNHPSIMIWNACINHGGSEDFLVKAGREEDPSRSLGQHDVMAPMDFRHGNISTDNAITIEHTGHTYPTDRGERNSIAKSRRGKNREFLQAQRHQEMINLSYQAPGNYGMASWCGYDYNTFHNSDAAIARHGIFDLFRLPKFSYWWHQSELTENPMAYLVRVDRKRAVVYSNADEVRLYTESGDKLKLLETRQPDQGWSLNHPPFSFSLPNNYRYLKAEALIDGKVVATSQWGEAEKAAQIQLTADRATITADGSDITRIIITILDKEGFEIEKDSPAVTLSLKGAASLIGENPVQPIAGKQIILIQAGYQPGEITLTAEAKGLRSSEYKIKITPPSDSMIFPPNFSASMPTKPDLALFNTAKGIKNHKDTSESVEPFSFAPIKDVEPGIWVISKPMMIGGISGETTVSVNGGEYRIYTEKWQTKKGIAQSGDALYIRVKSSSVSGETVQGTLKVGNQTAMFKVTTK